MEQPTADSEVGLVDLTDLPLAQLRHKDDSAFAQCVERVMAQAEDSSAVMVVGFQSTI